MLIKRCHNNNYLSCNDLQNVIDRFEVLKIKNNWKLLNKLQACNIGNDKWEGHYAIDTTGGDQHGIIEGKILLANNIADYCHKDMSEIIKYQLLYYMFHCEGAENFIETNSIDDVKSYISSFKEYIKFNNLDIKNYCCDETNILKCCISFQKISYEDFEKEEIQLCHLEPVTKQTIKYHEKYILISSHNYGNVAWGLKQANMFQSNYSIEQTNKLCFNMTINMLKNKLKITTDNDEKIELFNLINGLNKFI